MLTLNELIKKMPGAIYIYNEDVSLEKWKTKGGEKALLREAEYILSTYYEGGHVNYDLEEDDYDQWVEEIAEIEEYMRLIKKQTQKTSRIKKVKR
jgi:hypothetical protein